MPHDTIFGQLRFDLRFAMRQHRRHKIVSGVVIATLGLSVAANTALFALVRYVILAPSPFVHGDEIVGLWKENPETGMTALAQRPELALWRARLRSYSALEAYAPRHEMAITGYGDPTVVDGADVTPEMFRFLRVSPVAGRSFTPGDTMPAAPRVAMIGYSLWRTEFGGTRDVMGRPLTIDGTTYTIVGVTPRGFALPMDISTNAPREVWLPLGGGRPENALMVLGRLRPRVSSAQAARELDDLVASIAHEYHVPGTWAGRVERARDLIKHDARTAVLTLFGAVLLLWLVASLNVASVLLGQALGRMQEFFVRGALGASGARVARQLVTESMVLAIAGCGLGLLGASWLLRLLVAIRPEGLHGLERAALDPVVVAFGIITALVGGALCGFVPSLSSWLSHAGERVRDGFGPMTVSRRVGRAQGALVIASVASALVLLLGAGLLVRTVSALQGIDHGLDTGNMLTFRLRLPAAAYSPVRRTQLLDELRSRLLGKPGVTSVAYASAVPQVPGLVVGPLQISSDGNQRDEPITSVQTMSVGPGYFRASGMALHDGEGLDHIIAGPDLPAVVNASMARHLAGGGNPIGARFRLGHDGPWSTVVGVVADVRLSATSAETTPLQAYYPWDSVATTVGVIVRTTAKPGEVSPWLRAVVTQLDPTLPVRDIETLDAAMARGVARQRFSMWLLSVVALLAVLLAVAGLYGVIAAQVRRRTREFGLRIALGAPTHRVFTLVLRQAGALVGLGIVIGAVVGIMLTGWIRSLLYGVAPTDPVTFVGAAVLVIAVAAGAAILPARSATTVDVVEALRQAP